MKKITFPLTPQMKQPEIADLHAALSLMGFEIAGAEVTNNRYGQSTRNAIRQFQSRQEIPATGIVDEATASRINTILVERGVLDAGSQTGSGNGQGNTTTTTVPPEAEKLFVVEGEVVQVDGTPLQRYPVRAFDRSLTTWSQINDTAVLTDTSGRYRISYDPAKLNGKTQADLKVEVYQPAENSNGNSKVVASSPLVLQARPKETLDFVVGKVAYRGPDEYSRLRKALTPKLSPINDLNSLEVADVVILARDTRLAKSSVGRYIRAQRWSAQLALPAELFFALLQQRQPARLDSLMSRPFSELWATLEKAKAQNVISLPLDEALRSRFNQAQQQYLANAEHPYSKLLGTTSLKPEQQSKFTRRLTAGVQTGDSFWESLQKDDGFTETQISELKATLEVQAFASNNAQLAVQLRGPMKVRVPRDVAAFSLEEWRSKILVDTAVQIPADFLPEKKAKVRREAYARALDQKAQLCFPTPALVAQMGRNQFWAKQPVFTFLKSNPEFEFDKQRITDFLKEHPDAVKGFPDANTARRDLLRLEQLFHITPHIDRLEALQALWESGLSSAPRIAAAGQRGLARRIGKRVTKPVVNAIYRKAVHVTSMALNFYMRFHPQLNRLSLPAMRTPQLPKRPAALPVSTDTKNSSPELASKDQALAAAATDLPEWTELFGSADNCACLHCESTLGPTAYLVDMMDFLTHATDGSNKTGLDYLLERRPDLGLLQLTCNNTETEIKKIDLVLEIMEQIVAFSTDGTTIPTANVGQTTWDSELLAATPENFTPEAYEKLKTAFSPFNVLPFNLWIEEGRRYLQQMGVARDELMRVMPPRREVGPTEIAAEALKIAKAEQDLILKPEKTRLHVFWGVDTAGSLVKQLRNVKTLLDKARIDYDTLLQLLNTRYLNPGGAITVAFSGEPCSLEEAQLNGPGKPPTTDDGFLSFFDRLHRFLRLQRKLGWTAYELDLVIQGLRVKDFDERDFLNRLAAIQSLHETCQLNVSELATWWANLDVHNFEDDLRSQYDEIFLNLSVFPTTHSGTGVDLRNKVFALTTDRRDLVVTQSTDPNISHWLAQTDGATSPTFSLQQEYSAYIQSAARVTADDLLTLVTEVLPKDTATGHVALNLGNVSLIYRIGSFTAAMGITVKDYLRLVKLAQIVPVMTPGKPSTPLNTQDFKIRFDEINQGDLSLEQLVYLLLHESEAASILSPKPDDTDALMAQLSPAFVGIKDPLANPDLTASLTQSLSSSIGLDAELLDELLFTLHKDLGRDLLANLIVAANPTFTTLPVPTRTFQAVFETLHKFGLAWYAFGFDASHLSFLVDKDLDFPDMAALPLTEKSSTNFEPWRRLTRIANLQRDVFSVENSVFALSETLPTHSREQFLALASDWTGWSLADLTYLTGPAGFNYAYPTAFQKPDWLLVMRDAFALLVPMAASAQQAHSWTIPVLTSTESESIKQVLTLAYDRDRWLEVMTSIQDELRLLKRDALLGYMLKQLGTNNSDDFYRHYLIDPEISSCALTSRIVEAHATVQLFAQRILLNLEQPLTFGVADAEALKWRKNYRVWEAARKVFLYPENWMEPELRDDKTTFFKELEDGLMQDDVTLESAGRLYSEYLRKLDQVSRVEIMGMYEDKWMDGETQRTVLHVVGRTRDISGQYYYRRWEDQKRWTSWERVDLDIQGNHVIPVVYNGKLYLFWPDFKQTQVAVRVFSSNSTSSDIEALKDDIADLQVERRRVADSLRIDFGFSPVTEALANETLDNPNMEPKLDDGLRSLLESWLSYNSQIVSKNNQLDDLEAQLEQEEANLPDIYEIELGMCWSQYQSGTWSRKMMTDERRTYGTNFSMSKHFFSGWVSDDNRLCIAVHTVTGERLAAGDGPVEGYVGYFYLDDSHSNMVFSAADTPCPQGRVYLYGSYQSSQHWDSFISENVSLDVTQNGQTTNRSLLEKVSIGSVDVNFAHQYGLGGSVDSPFFINDISRTYFVRQQNSSATQINVHNFDLELETFTLKSVSGKELDTRKALPRVSSARSGGVNGDLIDAGIVAQPDTFAIGHYGGFSDSIISHSNGQTFTAITATQVDVLDALLSTDSTPQYIPQGYVVASSENQQLVPQYVFTRFYHPYTGLFTRQLGRRGVGGLLNPDPEWDEDSENLYRQLTPLERFEFDDTYSPNLGWVSQNFSAECVDERIDFDHDSPYGVYNWELFFHIPLVIATRLMQNQRFAEARTWFQYIFDPTYSEGASPARYWKVKPLYEEQLKGPAETLQEMIDLLEQGDQTMEAQVEVFESEPFQPFAIARLRPVAYMQTTVMKFLDCLIAEADSLFKMDIRESIAEAAQLYMLAAEILGEKPTLLPAQETVTKTPNQLLARFKIDIDIDLSDPLDTLTSMFPNNLPGAASSRTSTLISSDISIHAQGSLSNYNTLLAFAIPHNEKLYGYWNTLADRLFKIRNCMNISGQVRELALFAPPIDPALLVRAAQAGLDIASVISNLYAPLPKYRFAFMLQKALEFSNEVRNLGSALQVAIEKQDAEELSLLRSTHEIALLEAITEVKTKNVEEAETSLETLNKNRESAELRHEFYSSRQTVSSGEQTSLDLQEKGRGWQIGAEAAETTGSVIALVPNMTGTAAFPPAVSSTFGGSNLAAAAQATAGFLRARSASFAYQSNKAGTMAGYVRREDDWQLQADLALKEIEQLDKQILAAEIRKQITERDLENHKQQIAQSEEVEEFLKLKFSNEQLYSWMVTKLSGLYFQAYQLAYQIARQAEKAFQHELGPNEKSQSYIQPTYWDSLKKGLLAGEQLALDLRRLEVAHLEANQRELEMTKHISLFQLDPAALLELRQTGSCEFDVPEVLFDMDFPGQYYRRIKSVRITVPCVVGPYTNVTGTLNLKSSRIRSETTYPLPALSPEQTVLPQTAIATSSVREDSGVFEFSFSDQRYLPFEGAGAVSGWSFELPAVVRQFDYDTIADVILHIQYTAREGGPQFKENINTELSDLKTAMQNSGLGLSRLFSLRKEFSNEWNRLLYPVNGDPQQTTLSLSKQHFPRYLNYLWEQTGDNWEPKSIDLRITSVRATLDPQGPLESADETVRLSAGLSGTTVTNESGVELNLTVTSGEMTAEKWKDVYVLMNYEVAV